MEKHIMQCFRLATYLISVFNMKCTGAGKYDHIPFLSSPNFAYIKKEYQRNYVNALKTPFC